LNQGRMPDNCISHCGVLDADKYDTSMPTLPRLFQSKVSDGW